MKDWHIDTFGEIYPIIYAHRTVEAAESEALFAAEALGLSSKDSTLDVGCGGGRHMAHLQKRVGAIVGLDYSAALLCEARELMPRCDVVRADMRAIPFVETFDAITNFFTSFGYFGDTENSVVVQQLATALRSRGRFFVDYFHPAYARYALQAESTRTVSGLNLQEQRWIDEEARRLNKTTKVYRENRLQGEYHESVRLYEPEEMEQLFAAHGMIIQQFYGDYDGSPLSPAKPRMIAVGIKG